MHTLDYQNPTPCIYALKIEVYIMALNISSHWLELIFKIIKIMDKFIKKWKYCNYDI